VQLVNDRRIVRLFVEHLDIELDWCNGKVQGIPLGFNPIEIPNQDVDAWWPLIEPVSFAILHKPLRAINVARVHTNGIAQFEDRVWVAKLCISDWRDFCDNAAPQPGEFLKTIRQYPFAICVHGGGIEPNPKVFSALLAGVIPIVERFPSDELYASLPIAFVESWNNSTLSVERLNRWRRELSPFFTDTDKRAAVVEQLTSAYWWKKVTDALAIDSIARASSILK